MLLEPAAPLCPPFSQSQNSDCPMPRFLPANSAPNDALKATDKEPRSGAAKFVARCCVIARWEREATGLEDDEDCFAGKAQKTTNRAVNAQSLAPRVAKGYF